VTITSIREVLSSRFVCAKTISFGPGAARRFATPLAALLLATSVLSFASQPAAATLISDGQTQFFPDSTLSVTGGTVVATNAPGGVTVTSSSIPPSFTATLVSSVVEGSTTNPFYNAVSSPDVLTFVYQFSNSAGSVDSLEFFDVQSFGTALTDVGYNGSLSGDTPYYVARDAPSSADVIAFDFAISPIAPGESSALLIVNTNATNWASVTAAIQDGANGNGASYAVFAPTMTPTPEPASIVMMVLGLFGLLAMVRGRRKQLSV
jgi:PEP-CTERM motif